MKNEKKVKMQTEGLEKKNHRTTTFEEQSTVPDIHFRSRIRHCAVERIGWGKTRLPAHFNSISRLPIGGAVNPIDSKNMQRTVDLEASFDDLLDLPGYFHPLL